MTDLAGKSRAELLRIIDQLAKSLDTDSLVEVTTLIIDRWSTSSLHMVHFTEFLSMNDAQLTQLAKNLEVNNDYASLYQALRQNKLLAIGKDFVGYLRLYLCRGLAIYYQDSVSAIKLLLTCDMEDQYDYGGSLFENDNSYYLIGVNTDDQIGAICFNPANGLFELHLIDNRSIIQHVKTIVSDNLCALEANDIETNQYLYTFKKIEHVDFLTETTSIATCYVSDKLH